jgi:hypothetical protein
MHIVLGVFKKVSLASLSVLWGSILFCSCGQDPIFYGISLEVEPVDPRIVGMPTNIVAVAGKVYVASKSSGTIHAYDGTTGWQRLGGPGGRIIELAATATHVYALTGEPGSSALLYALEASDANSAWKPVTSSYRNIQSIYGAGEELFACAMIDPSTFVMLHEVEGTLQLLTGGSGFLRGAVSKGTDYYLAGTGIYTLAGETLTRVSGTEEFTVIGLITLKDKVVGVSTGGIILYGDSEGFTRADTGVTFTGAIASWKKDGEETDALLLLGIQGGSVAATHGYREILLSEGTLLPDALGLRIPGQNEPSSVSDYDKYYSSLGKHPVVSLYQAADGILFAGTTKNGLWSYRNNQWNAEP